RGCAGRSGPGSGHPSSVEPLVRPSLVGMERRPRLVSRKRHVARRSLAGLSRDGTCARIIQRTTATAIRSDRRVKKLAAEIMAAWRRAERLTTELAEGSPEHDAARRASDRLRD